MKAVAIKKDQTGDKAPVDFQSMGILRCDVCGEDFTSGPGNTNHGYIQVTMLDHMIKSGEDLFVCQVSHRPE